MRGPLSHLSRSSSAPFVAPDAYERERGRAFRVRLGANESVFGPSPAARAAMRDAVERAQWYGDPEAWRLREVLAAREGVEIENISVGPGIDGLLLGLARAYLGPGRKLVTTFGSYPTLDYAVASVGAELVTVPYCDGRPDLGGLAEAARREGADVVYLANPDNPSGQPTNPGEIVAWAASIDAWVWLDEAYHDFAPELAYPIAGNLENVVALRTFSKAHGLAGLRVGVAMGPREVRRALQQVRSHFEVSAVGLAGALASLSELGYVRWVVKETRAGAEFLRSELAARGLSALGLGGQACATNFVLGDLGTRERAEQMVLALREEDVFIRKPGRPPLDRFVRITVGRPEDHEGLLMAIDRVLPNLG